LKQLDNWGVNKHCTGEQRWNWKANIDGGLEVVASKITVVNDFYVAQGWIKKIKDWNDEHNENKVTMDEQTFGGSKKTESFTYSDSPLFPNINFAGTSSSGEKHSFLDAVLIGKYNGGAFLFVLEEPKEDPDNPDKSLKPYWKLVSTYTKVKTGEVVDNLKYINDVCNEN